MEIVKSSFGLLLIIVAAVTTVSLGQDLFSANYDETIDAQVVPSGGNIAATITDADSDVGLSSGNKGRGGSGEGLRVNDEADLVSYKLNPTFPNTTWMPESGRITVWFKIDVTYASDLALFEFDYDAGALNQAYMQLGLLKNSGLNQLWFRARPYNGATTSYTGSVLPAGPLQTVGWHEVVFEWDMNGSKPAANSADGATADIRGYVDGVLSLSVNGASIGSPSTHNEFHVGSMSDGTAGFRPVSYHGVDNVYDDVKIEAIPTSCGEAGTVYLPGDISGASLLPDCQVNMSDVAQMASDWLDCTNPSDPTCSDYVGFNDIILFSGDQSIPVSPYQTWDFNIPAGISKAYLSLEARYNMSSSNGQGYPENGVRYWINNDLVGAKYVSNVADGRNLVTVKGYNLSWEDTGGTFRLPMSVNWNSFSNDWFPLELQSDPYRIVIDISKFISAGKRNRLWIQNMTHTTSGAADVVCRNAKIVSQYNKPAISSQYYDIPQTSGSPIVPQTSFNVSYVRTIPNGGGMTVTVNGVQYNIESKFSYPNGTWNVLTSGSSAQGEWSGNVVVAGNQVTATGQKYRLNRTVNNYNERIEVLDTITNLTAGNLGIVFKHYVKIPTSSLSKAYSSGLRLPTLQYTSLNSAESRFNSTTYVQTANSGIGLLAKDNVFRAHVGMEMVDNSYGIKDSFFVLAPSASYTVKWEIYPTQTADYYAFINAARRAFNANYVLDGSIVIASRYTGDPANFTNAEIQAFVALNNAKYVIYGDNSRLDSSGNAVPNDYIMGSDLAKTRGTWNQYWIGQWVNKYHSVNPSLVVLPYINPWLTTEPSSTTTYADSYVKDSGGSPYIMPGIPGGTEPAMLPTATNTYGPALKNSIDWILANADGFYMDASSVGPWDYRTDRWDNNSGQIDDVTFALTRTITDSSIYTLQYRLARYQDAINLSKKTVSNYAPVSEGETSQQALRFVETPFASNNAVLAHLSSPLSFPANTVKYDDLYPVWIKLRYGGLGVLSVWPDQLPHTSNILQDIYPIQPVELHCGYIIGTTKIITTVSGQYGFGDSSALTAKVYDAGGRYLPSRTLSGAGTVAVTLTEGEMAIITK